MGFSPQQVKSMDLRDFNTISVGLSKAQGGKAAVEPMSDQEMADLGIEGA